MVVPIGSFLVLNIAGVLPFLQRMFTGIRDDGGARGGVFEESVRKAVREALDNVEFGPRHIFENGVQVDEIDMMLRKDDEV